MKKKIFIITMLLGFSLMSVLSQDDPMKVLYKEAQDAYEMGDYNKALSCLNRVEQVLGKTNPKIAFLKTKAYFDSKQWEQTVVEADKFLSVASSDVENYSAIVDIKRKAQQTLDAQIAEQNRIAAEKEAERQRIAAAEAAERKRLADAAAEWERLKTSTDINALSSFISKYGNTPQEAPARQRLNDERAWQAALKSSVVEETEKYLQGATPLMHRQEALAILEKSYVSIVKQYASDGKLSQMDNIATRYRKQFPNGPSLSILNDEQCRAYTLEGNKTLAASRKSESGLRKAKGFYESAQRYCPNSPTVANGIRNAEKRIGTFHRPDYSMLGYSYDPQNIFGYTFGWLKQEKVGFYFTMGMNKYGLNNEDGSDGTYTDGEVKFNGNRMDNKQWQLTANKKEKHFFASIGLTKRLFYPLWLYAGAGYGKDYLLHEYEYYTGKEVDTSTEKSYIRDTSVPEQSALLDAGVILKISYLYLSGGVRTSFRSGGTNVALGAGIAF